jgi:transketolase
MRATFFNFIMDEAARDPNFYLVVGDAGFSYIEPFQEKYQQRFINAGLSAQNMIGMAAGLALTGKNVYIYAPIATTIIQCIQQIRNDICLQKLPIKIIGFGGGYSEGALGNAQHALEDIALMRSLPNMLVIAPSCKEEVLGLMHQIDSHKGPSYLRLSAYDALVPYPQRKLELGKVIVIQAHPSMFIAATGNTLDLAWLVMHELASQGIQIGLVSIPSIKPLDRHFLLQPQLTALFTLEEHFITGGFGEAIASLLMHERTDKVVFHAFGIRNGYNYEAGTRAHYNHQAGLTVAAVCNTITEKLATTACPQVWNEKQQII